jgi:hypothetical protein
MWAEGRRSAPLLWLAIAGLHIALLALLASRTHPVSPPAAWSELRLIPLLLRPEPKAPAPRPVEQRSPSAKPAPAGADAATSHEPASPTGSPLPTTAEQLPATATAPGRSTLQLTLPNLSAGARRNPAMDDPRGNTPTSSIGQKLVAAMGGDGRWEEEIMGEGRRRMRRGNTCVDVQRSRNAELNPFNESVAPTPWSVTSPYTCERR